MRFSSVVEKVIMEDDLSSFLLESIHFRREGRDSITDIRDGKFDSC